MAEPAHAPVNDLASERTASVRMLIIDDDPNVGQAMENFFTQYGFDVERARNGEAGLEKMTSDQTFDVITLDVMMPGIDGFEVLRRSQARGVTTPILMVTARGENEDVLRGLGLGARDYVVKPFDPDDLVERIERLLGRRGGDKAVPEVVKIGRARVDFRRQRMTYQDRELEADEQEFEVLRVLMQCRGEVVSRKRLLREAWGLNADHVSFSISPDVTAHMLERHVERLRGKIEPNPGKPRILETVIGQGYRLNVKRGDGETERPGT